MQQVFSNALGLMATGGVVVGTAIVGALYVIGLVRKTKEDEKEDLIKTLQGHVDALKTKQEDDHADSKQKIEDIENGYRKQVEDFTAQVHELTEEVKELRIENEALADVLKGRDAETQHFFKEAKATMEAVFKTSGLVEELSKSTRMLIAVASSFLKPEEIEKIKSVTGYDIKG